MGGRDTFFWEDNSLGFAAISNRFKGLEKMKKLAILLFLMISCCSLIAQEWVIEVEELKNSYMQDMVSVDDEESVLGIGYTGYPDYFDGVVVKIEKDGSSIGRIVHLPGMMLQYYSAVQLSNGNYMVFGICDDSLCDYHAQRFFRIDVFNSQLESVLTKTYSVDDDIFDCFYNAYYGKIMKSMISKLGTITLAARLSYSYKKSYRGAVRFYEFDEMGEIIKMVDNPLNVAYTAGIGKLTYEPHSDNLLVTINGGSFPPHSGLPGIYVVDNNYNIVAKQDFIHIQGGLPINVDEVFQIGCEGKWIDNEYIILDAEKSAHRSSTYNTLYKVDSALNVYAELRLPPYDSCTSSPYGTSTAYINDTTIFSFTDCSEFIWSTDKRQVNVILVDKNLNLLGRKVIQKDNVQYFCSTPPARFEDGGCVIVLCSRNGDFYPGSPFYEVQFVKFRREDIEITWDVVNETGAKPMGFAYPNPTSSTINIPIDETLFKDARIQIFDAKGMKCLDSEVGNTGNLITLDVHNLDAGLYVYKVVSGKRELTSGKFIKE